nr:MAG TPA: Argonaute linker 1 domain protein [Herelleviridae sp.]
MRLWRGFHSGVFSFRVSFGLCNYISHKSFRRSIHGL